MLYFNEEAEHPFVFWPSYFFIGSIEDNHRFILAQSRMSTAGERPIAVGYYDADMKALHWYDGPYIQHGSAVGKPPAHVINDVVLALKKRGLFVKILDKEQWLKTKGRYPKRDFNKMRSESVTSRDKLIEAILSVL